MVSPLFFYQRVLWARGWRFVMLPIAWPSARPTPHQKGAESESIHPKRQCAPEPKACAGLTKKPPCLLGDPEGEAAIPSTPVWPAPRAPTNRRPRVIDTSRHFCPHSGGD